jgi:hypothetical protein
MRLLDLWNFQCREIEEARLRAGEDEQLEAEKRVLANAEKIYGAAINAFDLLYEGNASTSSSLRAAQKHLEELARYEPKFQEALAELGVGAHQRRRCGRDAARLCGRDPGFARATGGDRRAAGAAGSSETQVRADARRNDCFWR